MGRDFKQKESNPDRIKRWLDTPRDAFGLFTGVPNQIPIEAHLRYYGEYARAAYDYQAKKKKLKNDMPR